MKKLITTRKQKLKSTLKIRKTKMEKIQTIKATLVDNNDFNNQIFDNNQNFNIVNKSKIPQITESCRFYNNTSKTFCIKSRTNIPFVLRRNERTGIEYDFERGLHIVKTFTIPSSMFLQMKHTIDSLSEDNTFDEKLFKTIGLINLSPILKHRSQYKNEIEINLCYHVTENDIIKHSNNSVYVKQLDIVVSLFDEFIHDSICINHTPNHPFYSDIAPIKNEPTKPVIHGIGRIVDLVDNVNFYNERFVTYGQTYLKIKSRKCSQKACGIYITTFDSFGEQTTHIPFYEKDKNDTEKIEKEHGIFRKELDAKTAGNVKNFTEDKIAETNLKTAEAKVKVADNQLLIAINQAQCTVKDIELINKKITLEMEKTKSEEKDFMSKFKILQSQNKNSQAKTNMEMLKIFGAVMTGAVTISLAVIKLLDKK